MRKNRPVSEAFKLRVETAKKLIPLVLFTGERERGPIVQSGTQWDISYLCTYHYMLSPFDSNQV